MSDTSPYILAAAKRAALPIQVAVCEPSFMTLGAYAIALHVPRGHSTSLHGVNDATRAYLTLARSLESAASPADGPLDLPSGGSEAIPPASAASGSTLTPPGSV